MSVSVGASRVQRYWIPGAGFSALKPPSVMVLGTEPRSSGSSQCSRLLSYFSSPIIFIFEKPTNCAILLRITRVPHLVDNLLSSTKHSSQRCFWMVFIWGGDSFSYNISYSYIIFFPSQLLDPSHLPTNFMFSLSKTNKNQRKKSKQIKTTKHTKISWSPLVY